MDSTPEDGAPEIDDGSSTRASRRAERWRRTSHALFRWLPAPIITAIAIGATSAVLGLTAEPLRPSTVESGETATTPVLSIRRLPVEVFMVPIVDRRDEALRSRLAAFVAGQPPDTCLVVDDDRGVIFDHRGDDPQVPASAQKIVTATAALLALGPTHRFETVASSSAPIENGTLAGDLFLVGGGDPLLASADYALRPGAEPRLFTDIGRLADDIVAAGVTRIDGRVVGDDTRYDPVRYHPAWPPRFTTQNQTGPLSALYVNDGFASYPEGPPIGYQPAPDPATNAAEVLAEALMSRGVVIGAPAASGVAPDDATTIATLASAPLLEVVAQSLRESDNGTSELLVKELAARESGLGSFEAGALVAAEAIRVAGFDVADLAVVDGSGLASENLLTCSLLVELLDHDPIEPALRAGMAVSGESGTLRNRWLDTSLVGRIRAKTGTLNQVTALAGYADGNDGAVRRFALVVNLEAPAVVQRSTVDSQEELAEALVQVAPLPNPAVFAIEPLRSR